MDILDRFTNRKPRTATLTFTVDPDDADEHARLKKAVTSAEAHLGMATGSAVTAAVDRHEAAVAALEAFEAESETITFHLAAIGPAKAEQLRLAHPPTKEQRTRARAEANGNPNADPGWNDDTFPAALVAASLTKITSSSGETVDGDDITEARIQAMWDSDTALLLADRFQLFQTAYLMNEAPSSIEDLGKG